MGTTILQFNPAWARLEKDMAMHVPYRTITGRLRCLECGKSWRSELGCRRREALVRRIWRRADGTRLLHLRFTANLTRDDISFLQAWMPRKDMTAVVEHDTLPVTVDPTSRSGRRKHRSSRRGRLATMVGWPW